MQLPDSWLLLRTPPAAGAWNMACDVSLMDVARAQGVGILRVYEWSEPTVSFGRHERAKGVYSADALTELGLRAVRRPTGGRALLHSREVTYSVTIPMPNHVRWATAYDAVNARLLRAMQILGVPARIVGALQTGDLSTNDGSTNDGSTNDGSTNDGSTNDVGARAGGASTVGARIADAVGATPHDEAIVCFSGIAMGEIAVGDQKLIASSVWRERGAYLQHGSILIHDDQHRLTPVLGANAIRPEPAAVLSDWLNLGDGTENAAVVVERALHEAFRDCGNCVPWSIPRNILDDVEVVRKRMAEPDWLWRR
ncbi:MAG: hypothetical protein ABJB74_22795 [Gemmatimonas sp.]